MSTTYMTIYDLLRITYTYEAQAFADASQNSGCIAIPSSTYIVRTV